jgi:hypothetical protein
MGIQVLYKQSQNDVVLGIITLPTARSSSIGSHMPTTLQANVNHTQNSHS